MNRQFGKQFMQICKDERMKTIELFELFRKEHLPDAKELFFVIQETLNSYARSNDKYIHETIVPSVLRLMADELERISKRLNALMEGSNDE